MASRILNRNFRYRNADTTDVRLTFARIRRQWRKAQSRADVEAPTPWKREELVTEKRAERLPGPRCCPRNWLCGRLPLVLS